MRRKNFENYKEKQIFPTTTGFNLQFDVSANISLNVSVLNNYDMCILL